MLIQISSRFTPLFLIAAFFSFSTFKAATSPQILTKESHDGALSFRAEYHEDILKTTIINTATGQEIHHNTKPYEQLKRKHNHPDTYFTCDATYVAATNLIYIFTSSINQKTAKKSCKIRYLKPNSHIFGFCFAHDSLHIATIELSSRPASKTNTIYKHVVVYSLKSMQKVGESGDFLSSTESPVSDQIVFSSHDEHILVQDTNPEINREIQIFEVYKYSLNNYILYFKTSYDTPALNNYLMSLNDVDFSLGLGGLIVENQDITQYQETISHARGTLTESVTNENIVTQKPIIKPTPSPEPSYDASRPESNASNETTRLSSPIRIY